MLLPVMAAFVPMLIAMRIVSMVAIMAFMMTQGFLSPTITHSIFFLLLIDPGHEPFKLSTVQPDPPAHLTNIYGDTIAVLFFQSWFVASRTNHVDSFLIHNSPGTSG
jgi:hypothetical protein